VSRTTLAKVIIASVSTCLSLVAVEIGARLWFSHHDLASNLARPVAAPTDGAELQLGDLIELDPDPQVVFHLRRGLRGRFKGATVETNSHGHRGPESSVAKPPGTRRVIGIGDSVMFGWGVELSESYLTLLAERLATPSSPVEVINFGVPGYNTIQQVEDFAVHGVDLDPDLVVLGLNENDLDLPIFLWAAGESMWTLRRSFALTLLRSTLGLTSERSAKQVGGLTPFTERLDASTGSSGADDDVPQSLRPLVGEENFLAALDRLQALSHRYGFRVIVTLYFPSRSAAEPPSSVNLPHFTLPGGGNRNFQFFVTACRERGFEIVDPEDLFQRERSAHGLGDDGLWLNPQDSHPNVRAHALIANATAAVIRGGSCGMSCDESPFRDVP
jgi:hypothetical protein